MNIDLTAQPALLTGAVRTWKDADGFTNISRMTDELADFYSYSEGAIFRANCNAGIKIGFKSTTEMIKLDLAFLNPVRDLFKLDIIIDNTTTHAIGPETLESEFTALIDNLGTAEKTIEIYLTHCCEVKVKSLELTDGASLQPLPVNDVKWLAIGDSITQGMTATTPSQTYAVQTARALKADLHNIAVGGAVIKKELGELVSGFDRTMTTIAFGTNDFNQSRSLEDLYDHTLELLKALSQQNKGKIYLITTIPWAGRTEPNENGIHLPDYRKTLADAAAECPGVIIIDGSKLIDDNTALFADNVHPNNDGMTMYAENLLKQLSS